LIHQALANQQGAMNCAPKMAFAGRQSSRKFNVFKAAQMQKSPRLFKRGLFNGLVERLLRFKPLMHHRVIV
jgi:hypothetical protein